jgi:apoptosis-inducing factor 2
MFFLNMASPRGILPDSIPDDQLFKSLPEAFSVYPAANFEFVEGIAEELDDKKNVVQIKKTNGDKVEITYDYVVVATGTKSTDGMPWKNVGTYEETTKLLHSIQKKIEAAKTILVGGAGATGVETAGELGYKFGKEKEISIVTNSAHVLPVLKEAVGKQAELELTRFGVTIIPNSTVVSAEEATDGKTTVKLSDGKTLSVDLYISSVGLVPNTAFMPAAMLNNAGKITVNSKLQVPGGPANLYAIGDVNSNKAQIMMTEAEAVHMHKNLDLVLKGQSQTDYKEMAMTVLMATLGPTKGTGQLGWFKFPSFAIVMAKGKTAGVDKVGPFVNGGKLFSIGSM